MQYDLNLLPNGAQRIEVEGRFFKYTKGSGQIRVITNKGAVIDLTQGQGVWGEEFSSLTVMDRSGSGGTGTLLAGNYDFRDDTVTVGGSINVGSVGGGSIAVSNTPAQRVPVTLDTTQNMPVTQTGPAVTNGASAQGNIAVGTVIVAPATNTKGLVLQKMEAFPCGTVGANITFYASNGTTSFNLAFIPGQTNPTSVYTDNSEYVLPAGFGLYVTCASSSSSAYWSALWTLK